MHGFLKRTGTFVDGIRKCCGFAVFVILFTRSELGMGWNWAAFGCSMG